MFKGKTILISALDWGLGHATRCVPLIRELKKENRIFIGSTPLTSIIFDEEFPDIEKIEMPPYDIRYSNYLSFGIKLLLDSSRILGVIKTENKLLQKIISEKNIDTVISDNRYGLHSPHTTNVLITHQVFLKSPFANFIAQKINRKFILKFNELWIPDYEDISLSLSGELSHGQHFHPNVKFLNPQSRLEKKAKPVKYDYLMLLSGPHPQQGILREKLVESITKQADKKFALVTDKKLIEKFNNLDVFITPKKDMLEELIAESETIICRSGYSTLMDLHLAGKKKLILIPTQGQSEQEYLAEYWQKKFFTRVLEEKAIKNFNF